MVSRARIIASIERHCQALTANDKGAWLTIWANDVVIEDPVGVSRYEGLDAVSTALWREIEAISPLTLWLENEVIVCGNEAIAILMAEVSSDGGRRKVGPIIDHFVFGADGKIIQMRAFWKYD